MKKIIIKFSTITIYLILVLSLSGFHLSSLIDMKSIVLIIGGTIFLSLSSMKKEMSINELRSILSWNSIVVSYLTTFIFLFISLSTQKNENNILNEIALNCRTLLYGFILFVMLKNDSDREQMKNKKDMEFNNSVESLNEENKDKPKALVTAEDIYYRYRELGLTQREAEIARLAGIGLSNKEIAEEMFIAESTVKKHLSHIFEKLGISNRESLKNIQ